jgi:hypothetical protein
MRARGTWHNDPVLHQLPGTRDVELPEEFVYVDRHGHRHVVPARQRSDGMTSPAWSCGLIGSPLTPDYRRPCVLHDYHVRTQSIPSARASAAAGDAGRGPRGATLGGARVAVLDAHAAVRTEVVGGVNAREIWGCSAEQVAAAV